MDTQAWRLREVVVEACTTLAGLQRGGRADEAALAGLEYLRAELLAGAMDTCDGEAADAACGVAAEIDALLAGVAGDLSLHRAAV